MSEERKMSSKSIWRRITIPITLIRIQYHQYRLISLSNVIKALKENEHNNIQPTKKHYSVFPHIQIYSYNPKTTGDLLLLFTGKFMAQCEKIKELIMK